MVGKNAAANPNAVKEVARLAAKSGGSILVANHSMTHTTPLPKQGTTGAAHEIMDADAILAPNIAAAQAGLTPRAFFRPPYGAFTSLGATNISKVNAAGAEKYTGPVFWDIGGELAGGFSADWACWGKKISIETCRDGYVAETEHRGRGIVLVHDVHSKTIDMLKGVGNTIGLIKKLRAKGFKFVGLRSHEAAVQTFQAENARLAASTSVSIDAKVDASDDGHVVANVTTQNAAKVVAQFDNSDRGAIEFVGNKALEVQLAPGSHFLTVVAFDANDQAVGQQKYSFVVPAPIEAGSAEAENSDGAVCVNFDLMKAGQLYRLYHDKIDCSEPDAKKPPFVDECYRYKGVLKTTRDPKLVGASEWSVEFDLSYHNDVRDQSKVGFIMDAKTGEVHAATRFARGTNRTDVPMVFDELDGDKLKAACDRGEWRGKFVYTNAQGKQTKESFLFRMVKNPQTNSRIHYQE